MTINLTVKEVELMSRMASRVKHGRITTHRDWFEKQCEQIGISDLDRLILKMANYRMISRSSKSQFWPVTIMIGK